MFLRFAKAKPQGPRLGNVARLLVAPVPQPQDIRCNLGTQLTVRFPEGRRRRNGGKADAEPWAAEHELLLCGSEHSNPSLRGGNHFPETGIIANCVQVGIRLGMMDLRGAIHSCKNGLECFNGFIDVAKFA